MQTIPASDIVTVNPGVLAAGGSGLALNGMILTESTRVPTGTAAPFGSATAVGNYFGNNTPEYQAALNYFAGFDNSNIKPSKLYYTQYTNAAVAAYLRGGTITGIPIATLGGYSGSLTVLVDGYTHTAASINLTGCTSYSNAASIIQTGLTASEPTEATSSAGTIAGTAMTVGGSITGTFAPGQTVTGTGVTANSIIVAQVSGTTGGAGVYTLSQSSTVGSPIAITAVATAPTVTFDSTAGAFVVTSGITGVPSTVAFATGTLAPQIFLQAAQGAVLSQGAAATTPATFMASLVQITQNWAGYTTLFDPDGGSGNTQKLAFANWTAAQNNRWLYVCNDNDATATNTVPATSSLGYLLTQSNASGICLIYDPVNTYQTSAFILGAMASIDFTETQGRITFKFKSQSGLPPGVTNQTTAENLIANAYNFYGAYATANQNFTFFSPGSVTGKFVWLDSYVDQIWLNNSFQSDLMIFLTQVKSVPYTQAGRDAIIAACGTTINAGLNFGAFSPGVELTSLQKQEVNNAAGLDITGALFTQGYYFQVLPGNPSARAARTSPPCTFWYCDGGSVQQINLASIEIQ